jgi:GTP-binding protein
MPINEVRFIASNTGLASLPKDGKPEYAFIGRSNVGKSSLINMLCNRTNLAKTSSTPGKTKLINHFLVDERWYLVDLPGYGYARLPKSTKEQIQQMINNYITKREQMACVMLLLDCRLEPQKSDLDFINWLGVKAIPFVMVFTKSDKLTGNQLNRNISVYKKKMLENWEETPQIFVTSSTDRTGRDEILEFIEVTNKKFKIN